MQGRGGGGERACGNGAWDGVGVWVGKACRCMFCVQIDRWRRRGRGGRSANIATQCEESNNRVWSILGIVRCLACLLLSFSVRVLFCCLPRYPNLLLPRCGCQAPPTEQIRVRLIYTLLSSYRVATALPASKSEKYNKDSATATAAAVSALPRPAARAGPACVLLFLLRYRMS